MGILGITSNVLTRLRIDTSQQRSGLKKLSGVEKKRHLERQAQLNATNAKLDKQIAGLGKAALAVGALAGTYVALKKGFEAYATRQQMLAAGAGKELGKLQEASQGLITKNKLLAQEAAMLNGAVKMTGDEMARATKFMLALRKEGNDFEEVQKEVTKAFVELNVRGLEKFGVNIKAAKGSTDAFNKLLKEADKHVNAFGGDLGIKGDNVRKTMTALTDATDDLKVVWGEFAEKVLPIMIKGLGMILEGYGKLFDLAVRAKNWFTGDGKDMSLEGVMGRGIKGLTAGTTAPLGGGAQMIISRYRKQKKTSAESPEKFIQKIVRMMEVGENPTGYASAWVNRLVQDEALTMEAGVEIYSHVNDLWYNQLMPIRLKQMGYSAGQIAAKEASAKAAAQADKLAKQAEARRKKEEKKKKWKNLPADKKKAAIQARRDREAAAFAAKMAKEYGAGAMGTGWRQRAEMMFPPELRAEAGLYSMPGPGDTEEGAGFFGAIGKGGRKDWMARGGLEKGQEWFGVDEETRMDKFLGKLGSLDEGTFAVNKLSEAFHGMAEAFGSAIGAWLEGSDSFTGAMKKMTANFLKNLAIQESIEALKHGAYAIGSLAFMDFRGAALHAKAAAMHGVVAVAAGVGARQLGVGAQAPSTVSTAGAGARGSRSQTIILGADFADDSARRRSHRLASILAQADRSGAGGTVVEYA